MHAMKPGLARYILIMLIATVLVAQMGLLSAHATEMAPVGGHSAETFLDVSQNDRPCGNDQCNGCNKTALCSAMCGAAAILAYSAGLLIAPPGRASIPSSYRQVPGQKPTPEPHPPPLIAAV